MDGSVYVMDENRHAIGVLRSGGADTVEIDVFTPLRADWLDGGDACL